MKKLIYAVCCLFAFTLIAFAAAGKADQLVDPIFIYGNKTDMAGQAADIAMMCPFNPENCHYVVIGPDAPATSTSCSQRTTPGGVVLPETSKGSTRTVGCFKYTCGDKKEWTSVLDMSLLNTGGCVCNPDKTYYKPCETCGTSSKKCNKDGSGFDPLYYSICDTGSLNLQNPGGGNIDLAVPIK